VSQRWLTRPLQRTVGPTKTNTKTKQTPGCISRLRGLTGKELRELLDDAKASKKRLCADGKEKTKDCRTATTRVDTLTDKWTNAGTPPLTAAVAAGEGDVGRALSTLALAGHDGSAERVLLGRMGRCSASEIAVSGHASHSA
jgi:hypothetical protein